MPQVDALILLAAFIVGASKGGLAMIGMMAVPILALRMDPLAAAALLLPVYVCSDMVGLALYRRDFSRRNVMILIPSTVSGVAVATWLAPIVPSELLLTVTGLIGITFCFRTWVVRSRTTLAMRADVPRGIFWGVLTGITSFISHAGAPPYQTYVLPQRLPKTTLAATTTITFAAINIAKLPAYWTIDLFVQWDAALTAIMIVTAICGTIAGYALTRIIPERYYVLFIQIALLLVSLRLFGAGIFGLL
jgi:uncharacterized membrane protein YfcA